VEYYCIFVAGLAGGPEDKIVLFILKKGGEKNEKNG